MKRILWITICILIFGMFIRVINVMTIPLYVDEVFHLNRAHRIVAGELFAGMRQNKWLYGYVLSWFNPTGPEGPFIARYINALWGVLSIASCVKLAHLLFRDVDSSVFAGLIYAIVPLATFHERQALTDPQVSSLAALSMIFTIQLVRTRRWWWGLLLALSLTAGRLTKPTIILFIYLPFIALFLFTLAQNPFPIRTDIVQTTYKRLKSNLSALRWMLFSSALVVAVYRYIRYVARRYGEAPHRTHQISISNTVLARNGLSELPQQIIADSRTIIEMIFLYVGPVILLLVVVALVYTIYEKAFWREVTYLVFPAILFIALVLAAGPFGIIGRYLLINVAALSVLAGYGLTRLWTFVTERFPGGTQAAVGLSIAGVLFPAMWFNYLMITSPYDAPWHPNERLLYFDKEKTNGYGHMAIVNRLLQDWQDERQHLVATTQTLDWASAYIGPRAGEYYFLGEDESAVWQYANWLAAGDNIYLVYAPDGDYDELGPNFTHTQEIMVNGDEALYRVVGAEQDLATQIYNILGDEPEFMREDYTAVGASLAANSIEHVLVYPYDHASILSEYTDAEVAAVPGDTWPLTSEAVQEGIAALDVDGGAIFAVVTYDPPSTDPSRIISSTLQEDAYLIGQAEWAGLLNVKYFSASPTDAEFEPVSAVFEGVIHLNSATVLNRTTHPGNTVEMALEWSSETAVEDNFFIFTHIIDTDGSIVAQHDGAPVGNLRPFTTWEPGEVITDRYAIRLPADLPSGNYQVVTGIYNPASQLRLIITEGSDLPDSVLVDTIEVAGGE